MFIYTYITYIYIYIYIYIYQKYQKAICICEGKETSILHRLKLFFPFSETRATSLTKYFKRGIFGIASPKSTILLQLQRYKPW